MAGGLGRRDSRRDEQRLVAAGYVFMFGSAIHIFDHLRRGQNSVTDARSWRR